MISLQRKNKILGTSILLAYFLFFISFGLSIMHEGMPMKDGLNSSKMSTCIFMQGSEAICNMSIGEHIQAWQNSLIGLPLKDILETALLLLVVFFCVPLLQKNRLRLLNLENFRRFSSYYFNLRYKALPLHTHLFSNGILNTKRY